MAIAYVVKTRLATGTQIIQLRTGGTSFRLGSAVFTEAMWVITEEVFSMLRRDNPDATFVDETPKE